MLRLVQYTFLNMYLAFLISNQDHSETTFHEEEYILQNMACHSLSES